MANDTSEIDLTGFEAAKKIAPKAEVQRCPACSESVSEVECEPEPRSEGLITTLGATGIQADAAGGWKSSAAMHAKASGTVGDDSLCSQ